MKNLWWNWIFPAICAFGFLGFLVAMSVIAATFAKADVPQPNPGCGFVSALPWSPCAETPPIPGNFWTPIDGIPGTVGPHGYTPITKT